MNQERKMSKEKENDKTRLSNSVDAFVSSVKAVLNGNKERSEEIPKSITEFNVCSNAIIEELRRQNKYKI